MSKQLLHSCRSDVIVVATNDRAYAVMVMDDNDNNNNNHRHNNNDNNNDDDDNNKSGMTKGDDDDDDDTASTLTSAHATALELLSPPSSSSCPPYSRDDDAGEGGRGRKAGEGDDDDDDDDDHDDHDDMADAGNDARISSSTHDDNRNPLEIQAVCCHRSTAAREDNIDVGWFAVSRENKTLSLYRFPAPSTMTPTTAPSSSNDDDENGGTTTSARTSHNVERVRPIVTYDIPRRARCLAFATVPRHSASPIHRGDMLVVVVGDMSGDAWSFPVPVHPTDVVATSSSSSSSSYARRLLLGHTASILTGLCVVPLVANDVVVRAGGEGGGVGGVVVRGGAGGGERRRSRGHLILTADRDERVRVSSFPNSHVERGYLLGHASFVSTMDAVFSTTTTTTTTTYGVVGGDENEEGDGDDYGDGENGRTLCVTGSGDGTVRLWDCASFAEIGMVPVTVIEKCPPPAEEGARHDETNEEDGIEVEDEEVEGGHDVTNEDDGIMVEDGKEEEEPEGGDVENFQEDSDERNDDDDDDDVDDVDEENSHDRRIIAVPVSVALSPSAKSVIVARDGISAIDVHPIPSSPVPSKPATSSSPLRTTSSLVSLHEKQTLACPSQPLAVRCLLDGSVLALVRGPEFLLHYRCNGGGVGGGGGGVGDGSFENVSTTSPFCTLLRGAIGHENCDMPKFTLERDKCGEWMLRKARVLNGRGECDGENGSKQRLHWNDTRRRDVAKLRLQRRRKRRRERN